MGVPGASAQGAQRSATSGPGTQEGKEVAALMERRREFEENFTRTIRDLRKELEQSNIKSLSASNQIPLSVRALIQLSNERIEKAMEEVAQVPVEERLHIETLRLLMENAKLRKNLNGLLSLPPLSVVLRRCFVSCI